MQKKTINSQFNNFKSYLMYLRQCRSLAENVFLFENLPEYVDVAYINKILVEKGSIAWFKDEVMGLLALPWVRQGNLDVYGRPTTIRVYGTNGYTKVLNVGEYVIMYDNYGKYPLLLDITQYAQRLANCVRVQDINVSQQKTPRYWKTSQDKVESIKGLLNKIDSDENAVIGYDDIDIDNTQCVLEPAPYVTDKLDDYKNNIFNEFLRLIGVANLTVQKKERNIKDEVLASQGGTIASRFSRFEPRKKAVDLINEKFDVDIQVKFFDGLPTSLDTFEDKVEDNLEYDNQESEVE
jgi:hypothetical protein